MFDPHIWTDPINLIQLASTIRDALIELSPENETQLRANAQAYIDELQAIHIEFSDWSQTRTTDTMMHGGHNAFAYFAARYDIRFVNAYRGFSTDAEPTPGALQEMISTMRAENATHLFSEELIPQNVAQTIARETGAVILYLYSKEKLSQEEFNNGITLFEMFRHNLEQLKIGMGPRD
jgi:zinc transport system substrate-binding protein